MEDKSGENSEVSEPVKPERVDYLLPESEQSTLSLLQRERYGTDDQQMNIAYL